MWVVVKIMVPFWGNKDPNRDHNFDNHPYNIQSQIPKPSTVNLKP